VVKKFRLGGASLPNGRIVALNGEPGIQADTLAPGIRFWYWPWVYRVEKVPAIVVPPGFLGLVNARDGDPIPVNRILCGGVPSDSFQDARKSQLGRSKRTPVGDAHRRALPHQYGAV
jgi:hypothetical protein